MYFKKLMVSQKRFNKRLQNKIYPEIDHINYLSTAYYLTDSIADITFKETPFPQVSPWSIAHSYWLVFEM